MTSVPRIIMSSVPWRISPASGGLFITIGSLHSNAYAKGIIHHSNDYGKRLVLFLADYPPFDLVLSGLRLPGNHEASWSIVEISDALIEAWIGNEKLALRA
jgi:hypothetical protein